MGVNKQNKTFEWSKNTTPKGRNKEIKQKLRIDAVTRKVVGFDSFVREKESLEVKGERPTKRNGRSSRGGKGCVFPEEKKETSSERRQRGRCRDGLRRAVSFRPHFFYIS